MNWGSVGAGSTKGFPTEPLNGLCFLLQSQLLLNSIHLRASEVSLFFGGDTMFDLTSGALSHNVPEETNNKRGVTEHLFLLAPIISHSKPPPILSYSPVCILLHKVYDFILT